ncbi:MAG: DUF1353 domain-containing protein [Planctomycetota bacterium]|jgi:hypothetical protein
MIVCGECGADSYIGYPRKPNEFICDICEDERRGGMHKIGNRVKCLNEIVVSPLPGCDMYVLYKPLHFKVGKALFIVPRGFVFDGASIPKMFHSILTTPYDPNVLRAACIHDYLYRVHEIGKKASDRAFRAVLRLDGVDETQAMLMYTAVRYGGHSAYKEGPNKPIVGIF